MDTKGCYFCFSFNLTKSFGVVQVFELGVGTIKDKIMPIELEIAEKKKCVAELKLLQRRAQGQAASELKEVQDELNEVVGEDGATNLTDETDEGVPNAVWEACLLEDDALFDHQQQLRYAGKRKKKKEQRKRAYENAEKRRQDEFELAKVE